MASISSQSLKSIAIYLAIALIVMLPLLLPGFILTLDMSFTPQLRMPEQISSSYLFHAGLHYLNLLLPSEVIQKTMLLGILLLSGLGAHFLIRYIQTSKDHAAPFAAWGAYIAGTLYMINPYTYSRFMTGQYAVLLGYALLPFFVKAMLQFLVVPTLKRALILTGWLTAIAIVSVHTLGLAAVLLLAGLGTCAWRCRKNSRITLTTLKYGLLAFALFVAVNGYWLIPLLTGTNTQGRAIAQFSVGDQQAFATSGGDVLGKLGNILQLQGFWAEAEGLYLLPQEQLPGWGLAVLGMWVLVVTGAIWMWRNRRVLTAMFAGAAITGAALAVIGTGSLFALAGFREPHKFVGLVALAYAVFAGMGTATILAWAKTRGEKLFNTTVILILIIPVLLTPTMMVGFSGQLSPRQYPGDWYAMNDQLNRDTDDFTVLSLPWHLYMHYQFAGRVILNPTDRFFDKPTIISNQLEFKQASPTFPDTRKKLLSETILPDAAANPEFGKRLNELDIKYILLAKTFDYRAYEYLDHHPDLQLITETATLKLYRNLAYAP